MGSKGAVILAAGYSSRMLEFKPLLPLMGRTAVEYVIDQVQEAGVLHIVVVTGYRREALTEVIAQNGAFEVFNPDFDQGMFTSVKAGIAGLLAKDASLSGCILLPVDHAAVSGKALADFLGSFDPQEWAVPCYRGKKGHPLWIPERFFSEILAYEGEKGLKEITGRYDETMRRVETGSEGVVLDMDDAAGYAAVCEYLARGGTEENLQEMARGRRFFILRHGQIEQHDEKIFLGQSDIPLSEMGRKQAKEAGGQMREFAPKTDRIYSSDLSRTRETAEAISEATGITKIVYNKAFREMSLGAWDRKYISEIQEKYPNEYEKRGKNLLSYKFDHSSENFYDLRYRVVKGLVDILKKDSQRDIIIVSHSGAIKMLLASLSGRDIDEGTLGIKIGLGSINLLET